jgi:diguanylate cyclase (GGDEF)-like protein/PAS domain S-box-containing protein
MNLATFLIPPSIEVKQATRLRRLGLAGLAYAMTMALVAVGWAFGALSPAAALKVAAAYLVTNAAMYAVIRTGLNLRFADPSLTRFQILAGITVVMYIAYEMNDAREIALFGCFLVYLFGIFRLSAREFTVITLYTLAAYALVVNLVMHLKPQSVELVHREWMSWLLLAGFLPCFTIIGGQINTLRRRLRESEERFRGLTEMSTDFYWESDTEHRLTQRGSSHRTSNRAPLLQIGQRRWDLPSVSPDEAGWRAHRAEVDAHRPFRNFELSRLDPDGSERFISISGDPVFDASGAFSGYRGVGRDISARKQSERALSDSAQQLRMFADNIPAMTVSWDRKLRCRFANKVFTDFFHLTREEIIGKHAREILGAEAYLESEGHFAQVLQGGTATYQRAPTLYDGESRYFEVKLLPHLGEHGEVLGCNSVTTDITEHKLTEERIQRIAHHDSLTGLPNRLLFDDRLSQALVLAKRNQRHFALLYLDLDKFKPVNDTLGHTAGDEILKAVATRIRGQLRESDTVARIGGDEFTVILPDVAKREHAEIVARKIIVALALPFEAGTPRSSVVIGATIGIALYPADAQSAVALVKAADAAMYSAKQAGTGLVFCAV